MGRIQIEDLMSFSKQVGYRMLICLSGATREHDALCHDSRFGVTGRNTGIELDFVGGNNC